MTRKPVVVWVTNVSSPYRRPVWAALGRICELRVALLEADATLHREGRRGADWSDGRIDGVETWHPRVLRAARGERVLYLLLGGLDLRRRRTRAVLIGGWESPAFWQALAAARLRGARCVGFYESPRQTNRFSRGPIGWARARFFRTLDAVVVPGPAARAAVESFGVPSERIFEGFNAVDVAAFHSGSASRTESAGHRFVYVGQFIPRKNLRTLIQAFASVREPADTLTVIGDGSDREALLDLAREHGLRESFEVRPPVANAELPGVLAGFDTLALVSTTEVWGLVVNEALAARLHAVVARDAGVAPSVAGMRGVFETGTSVEEVAAALTASRAAWTGAIDHPEILAHTPESFAATFARALGLEGVSPT